ncbi:MAG TPA: hypothetical protein VIJ27_13780 [Mucilaginibacter sp.]
MVRKHFKKVLLVAPEVFPNELLAGYRNVLHISSVNRIFPSLYELNPAMVIFDYEFVGKDIEKILRRINVNKFYEKLKICCYKSGREEKSDSLLKALGVDYLVYREDLVKPHKTLLNNFNVVFDTSILKWMGSVSN